MADTPRSRRKMFIFLYIVIFLAAMWIVSSGVLNATVLCSIPIILAADAIVLGVVYGMIYYAEPTDTPQVPKP